MELRELAKGEYGAALEMAWRVFCEYEAPDYPQQGVDSFYSAIHEPDFIARLRIYGAYEDGRLAGVLATRSEGAHIALFFVEGRRHRQGIGKALLALACADNTSGKLTVNSSPYAVAIYEHLGFHPTDTERLADGIRYTPMECTLSRDD